jgi:nucleoside 2-deoxyribosyltransferase
VKAYFSLARNSRKRLEEEVSVVKNVLAANGMDSLVFVDQYDFRSDQEKEMMQQAMADIDACGLFVAEVSEKGIGVGLEAGYARGKGKKIIYLRHYDAQHSTTVSGISDYHVIYRDAADLKTGLEKIIKLWKSHL